MQVNTRVKSEHNTGTVIASENGIVAVKWDGFMMPIPGIEAASLEVVSAPPPDAPPPAPKGWDVVDTGTDDVNETNTDDKGTDDIDYDEEHERHRNNMRDDGYEGEDDDEDHEDDDGMTDAEADADTLRMAGMGTDEDYGHMIGGDSDLMGEW